MPVLHIFVNPIADEPGFLGTKPSDWNDIHSVDIDNADVNPAAGIEESKLALNFPTHAPVTLGAANGLVLGGQALSMNLAGANSTGTLSAQDWNVFNSKQSALSFPLLASLGGTSISNTGTFTNHSNTIFVGGGTLSLGGFTLTIPATGTAALLATANVFTVGQVIDGTADEIQLRVQAHSTQAGNIQTWESSTGTRLASMNSFGFGVGADAIAARTVNIAKTWTDTSGSLFGVYTNTVINPGANNSSATYKNYYSQITLSSVGTGNLTSTSGTTAFSIAANNNKTTGTVASLYAGMLGLSNLQTGTITNSYGEYIDIDNSGLGTMGTTYALRMRVRNTGGGTMNSVYGLYVDDINTASGNNYAIYTNAGLARFGGIVNTTESYQVDGTQVVSNRVVDARIDDTPNSGDATTDGIIAAIQTALVSHGLMAAA
jgi:hypothetical protein